MGERPGRREGGAFRERRSNALARMGDEELRKLRAGPGCAPVRGRGRAHGLGPAADRLPDGLSGVTYLAQGWLAGFEGFSPRHTFAIVLAEVLNLAWMIWLVLV